MYTGPKLTNSNLVFGYDTGYGVADNGTETRFYKGEPTTNLLPSPQYNGRFTTSNSWETYNTNQYNGNTYFDIGVIGSVSNNIVTLSTVGHVIKSFDVLTPQATGGGVTAGTHYVIKKISSTTFSLHEYNSSQNGSQGYTNPDTGFFKVHDAYANDTRVSISANGFPDMWWGYPHLPNSGLIKEIITNGGRIKGTNSMRFHIYRGDGVVDGMAYGVYTPVTVGDIITVSYWVRPVGTLGYGKYLGYSTYFGAGQSAPGFGTNLNSDGEWQLITHTWTASATVSFYSYFWPEGSTGKYAIDVADMQVEVNSGHATPFTLSTRSATASLIDLTKTTDIDVSNVSFDSTGQPEFDGTNDVITTDFPVSTISNVTIEAVVYRNQATGRYEAIVQNNVVSDDALYVNPSGYLLFWPCASSSLTVPTGQWSHVAVSYNGTTLTYIVNGTIQVVTATCSDITDWDFLRIGGHGTTDGERWIGKIAVAKVYEKSLSAAELTQNYNAYKNRFNL